MAERTRKSTKVELFISCRKLKSSGLKTFVEVYEKASGQDWTKLGTTEVISNSKDPSFATNFTLNYYFEENQSLRFLIHDFKESETNAEWNLVGTNECCIGQIIGSKGQALIQRIVSVSEEKDCGFIILRLRFEYKDNSLTAFQISGEDIEDVSGFFSRFEPFFCLSKLVKNGDKQIVYTSESFASKNPKWNSFHVKTQDLCAGDLNQSILLDVFDFNSFGSHEYIASAEFCINKIVEENHFCFELINPSKKQTPKYTNSGWIKINTCNIENQFNFLDFILGGCQIELSVAIDFTGSNKHPSSPKSLHYINPKSLNQYQQALLSVSEILLHYDYDKKVPMYGFGGKVNNVVSHCFPLSQNPSNPYAYGIEGIMDMYKNALEFVGLSGPTKFSDILEKVITDLENRIVDQYNQYYNILLILTDGEIHDMNETIDWIVRGSACPLSIVIVGVGNESFQHMKTLDADENPLVDSTGKRMARDIIQFVCFRETNHSSYVLAKEVLDEIPREISNFFKMKRILHVSIKN